MTNNLSFDIEKVKRYAKEKLGTDFELNDNTAKYLYFKEECNPLFFNETFYFEKFPISTLLSWNDEYLNNMEKAAQVYNDEPISLDNMTSYASFLLNLNEIYTRNKVFGYRIMKLLKQFINKYGYILFHGIENELTKYSKQYPYPILSRCLFYKYDERDIRTKEGYVGNLYYHISNKDYCGLIPFAIDNGLDDLYDECIKLLDEIFKKENLFLKEDIMKKMNISYSFNDVDRVLDFSKKHELKEINEHLKQFGREIK